MNQQVAENNKSYPAIVEYGGEKAEWFVMRFLYNDQPQVRTLLAQKGFETFCPMKQILTFRCGRKVREFVPAIRDLFFVHSLKSELDPYVARFANFQYRYKTGGKYREPLTVPEKQMNDFIAITGQAVNPLYFSPQELDLAKGSRIRLIGGPMDGYEAILLKVKGARAKRMIVDIPDTLYAAVEVKPDYIQLLD